MDELEVIHHRQIQGLSIFFDTVDHRTPHVHPEWELIWILENELSVACGEERYVAKPGDMILFNPSEPHEFHKSAESCTFLCLQISPTILPYLLPVHVDGRLPQKYMQEKELVSLRTMLGQIMRAYLAKEDHFGLYCVGKSCRAVPAAEGAALSSADAGGNRNH